MNKRLFLSTLLLLVCVLGVLNFSFAALADNNKNDNDKNDNKQERREERKDDKKCGLKNDEKLKASIDLGGGSVTFRNNEDNCTFKIGLASYNVYIPKNNQNYSWLNTQTLHDYSSATISPHQEVTLRVNLPNCSYQLDAFRGDVVEEFDVHKRDKNGGYDGRIISAGINSNLPLCGGALPTPTSVIPTATPTTAQPTPTKYHYPTPTPTHRPNYPTPTPTSPYNPTATPTPVTQIINNNNNNNTNNNEQKVIIEDHGVVREVIVQSGTGGTTQVIGVTDNGQPVYSAPQSVTMTPGTGPEAFSMLALIPTGIAGLVLRKRIK